ncbi:hypothetical protein FDP41_001348 [Naegleria fowleri]|uniref:Dynein regulatory complex subunit 3 n=1 Tax=Naegleria fowleri TaxID=5763 RepID=A0A6A5C1D2_NAEFO|nr:uncharacterized protein FDP41_001348 [Naegleria fowleri]KAF0979680.1 hypothetical protein FDP41_001348 [Naegleria fowleri]CAG4711170.1 unnamed protein product [Naegleria fowleri]
MASLAAEELNEFHSKYTVINDQLIRECIQLKQIEQEDGVDQESKTTRAMKIKRENMDFNEIEHLSFSFKNIFRISNLEGFDKLKKLQLDNNNISQIENLSHLVLLEYLDLSFNKITKIEGLKGLRNLKYLKLFSNEIEKIEGMEDLMALESLSIAKNKIKDKSSIQYLRMFPKLGMVTLYDNPVCEERDFRNMVLAFLRSLKFLDYRQIEEEEVQTAKERFHNELLKVSDNEEQYEKNQEQDEKKLLEMQMLEKANLTGIDDLFNEMFECEADETIKIFLYCTSDIIEKYRAKFTDRKDAFKMEMLTIMRNKENELDELNSTLQQSQYETNNISKTMVKEFEKQKKEIINAVKEMTAESEEEDLHQLDLLERELEILAEKLIEIEVNQSEAFWEVISEFIPNYKEMDCTSKIQNFFKKLKKMEEKYSIELRDRLMDQVNSVSEEPNEKVKDILEDKDQLFTMVQRSKEAHKEIIGQKELKLIQNEKDRMLYTVEKTKKDEHERNRARISEIWTFVERVKEEIEETRKFITTPEEFYEE